MEVGRRRVSRSNGVELICCMSDGYETVSRDLVRRMVLGSSMIDLERTLGLGR